MVAFASRNNSAAAAESNDRRDEQHFEDLGGLFPIHA